MLLFHILKNVSYIFLLFFCFYYYFIIFCFCIKYIFYILYNEPPSEQYHISITSSFIYIIKIFLENEKKNHEVRRKSFICYGLYLEEKIVKIFEVMMTWKKGLELL